MTEVNGENAGIVGDDWGMLVGMRAWAPVAAWVGMGLALVGAPAGAADGAGADGMWNAHVRPLLQETCFSCHGGAKRKGGLDLRTPESILAGGESGAAAVAGSRSESLIYRMVLPGADPQMPPKGDLLKADEVEMIGVWIDALRLPIGAATAEGGGSAAAGGTAPLWSPPAGAGIAEAVDGFLALAWARDGIEPAPMCGDAAFVRRVHLDLIGRVPTRGEADAWLADPAPSVEKRAALVEGLLASPEHSRHFADLLDVALLGRESARDASRAKRLEHGWHAYLREVVKENRPWDVVARELLTARDAEGRPLSGGAAWFLYEHRDDHQEMARTVGPSIFGRQVQCAQCHDHPLAPEILQGHYWGLVAFFNRSYNVESPDGPAVAERAAGGYDKFSNLEGESADAVLAFLNGRTATEPTSVAGDADAPDHYLVAPPEDLLKPGGDEDKKKRGTPKVERVPVPKFSRREALVETALLDDPAFAEAFVNRMWAVLFGRGIVHPVDKMDSSHPASHPDLLRWLGADFAANGHDIRRLLRGLVLSRAYQRASTPPGGGPTEAAPPPPPESFAVALHRPLTAEQFFRSMLTASGRIPDAEGAFPGIDVERWREAFVVRFPDVFPEVYAPSANRAMFLSNNPLFDELLAPADGILTEQLTGLSSAAAVVHEAFRAILLREPDADELAQAVAYLRERADRRAEAVRQLCWALVAGSEFRFNH